MHKRFFIIPLATVVFGVAGLALRTFERGSVFNETTGLALVGEPVSIALIVLSVLFVALLAAYLLRRGALDAGKSVAEAFSLASPVALAAYIAVGLLLIGGAAALLGAGTRSALLLVLALAAIAAGGCVFVLSTFLRRGSRGLTSLCATVVLLFFCFFLVVIYREHSADPALLSYCYTVLGLVSAVLGCYYCACFAFGRPSARRAVFFSGCAVFFLFITMADPIDRATRLIMLAAMLLLLTNQTLLLARAEGKAQ